MSGTVWSKFYWSDWLSDAGLRRCSFAARGLWIDLLCVASQHDPIGYVAVNNEALSIEDVTRMVGGSQPEVSTLVDELERNGVLSRNRKGVIYSRRMVRDAQKAAALHARAVKNGKEGGNPQIRRGSVPKERRERPYRRTDSPAKTRRVFERGGGKCHWCDTELVWNGSGPNIFHVDHVVPICDGGSNNEDNLVSACASCNHARARIGWRKNTDTKPDRKADTKTQIPRASNPGEVSSSDFSREKSSDAAATVIPFPSTDPGGDYAFAGRVVKLNQRDLGRWRRAYSNIPDLTAALQAADDYYAQNPPADGKWFFRVSRWLEEENKRSVPRRRVPDV